MRWPRAKLKFIARFGYGDALPTDRAPEGPFPVFGSNGPYASFSRPNTGAPAIIIGRKGSYGKVNWATKPCFACDTTFFVDATTTHHNLRWVYWLLQTLRLDEGTDEAAVPGLNRETAYGKEVACPPRKVQRAIADYLDRETAQIDALVAAKERVLGLLAEKRRALITRAVTRGLDPNISFRDSGIPWLGEIPAHWESRRFRWVIRTLEQGWSPEAENQKPGENEWGVLKLNAVDHGRFNPSAAKALPADTEARIEFEVHPGDLLITRSNTPKLVGDVCFVLETRAKLMLSDLIYRVRVLEDVIDGCYASHFLTVPTGRNQIVADARGTSNTMFKISQEHIKNWWLPLPPIDEQRAIVAHIATETAKLDNLSAATERTIALLKERRAALIAAAVTGKLDLEEA